VESQPALVKTQGRVELDTVVLVDLYLAGGVSSADTEKDLGLRLNDAHDDDVSR
jgi:hypothetical protein